MMRIKSTGWMAAALALTLTPPALGATAPGAAQDNGERVKMGVDAWQAGNFASALTIWRPLAEAGDADAQFNIAQAYRLGRGVEADPKLAMDWYLKAARQEHHQAEATYGLMLFQNGDQKGAMPWLQKAADHGDPRALYVVATAQFNGDPLPKDWIGAYARMTRAAASGLPQAKTSLAEMDRYIPADQREKGTAMAATMERGAAAGVVPISAPPARPAPPPIRTTELPPSQPASPVPVVTPPAPAVTRTEAPPPRAPEAGGWRVQFGAFANAEKARKVWDGIAHRIAPLASTQPYYVEAGAITRLQAGPFTDRGAATRVCVASKAAGQDCFVTAAP
jgi:cell division septation protein DedD